MPEVVFDYRRHEHSRLRQTAPYRRRYRAIRAKHLPSMPANRSSRRPAGSAPPPGSSIAPGSPGGRFRARSSRRSTACSFACGAGACQLDQLGETPGDLGIAVRGRRCQRAVARQQPLQRRSYRLGLSGGGNVAGLGVAHDACGFAVLAEYQDRPLRPQVLEELAGRLSATGAGREQQQSIRFAL